ncbi:unnamed protein product [Rotaria sordida]|uniref:VWFA domain-containing protein n=1 Tax=Rotaria sordida TaxID=392033 RepID=A0A814Y9P1_9BILA|nr:unnamed protein product [Rotaria sordida]CAF4053417.1 unnamed protein product [Rotaria sordida]
MYPRKSSDTNNKQNANRNAFIPKEQRMPDFEKFVRRYEINKTFANKLLQLEGYEIVFVCDDSGSMNTPLGDVFGPFNNAPTRWDELKQTVSIVVDLASSLDPNGVDIYFLNRDPIFHVRNSSELIPIFAVPPEATDGVPTDDDGHPDILSCKKVLQYERNPTNRIPVTIIACTDDDQSMDYLNDWDKEIPNLDVVDDYRNEKQQILKCQGNDFPFSFGDYIVKILMGGIDQWFDDLDERKVSLDGLGRSKNDGHF